MFIWTGMKIKLARLQMSFLLFEPSYAGCVEDMYQPIDYGKGKLGFILFSS